MSHSLALFDIDGTLTKGLDLHVQSFEHALKEMGIDYKINPGDYRGWVDRQIFKDVFRKNGKDLGRLDEAFLLAVNFYRAGIPDIVLLPKVRVMLQRLRDEGVYLGLVTGNIREIAYIKLKRCGISEFFKIGGFGDEVDDKKELVKLAIDRAGRLFGKEFNRIVLIGDTPMDVAAGKENGIITVAVAHGYNDGQDLSQADFVLDDFTDTEKVVSIIKG